MHATLRLAGPPQQMGLMQRVRYESKSIVMTTNLAFSEWPSIFPNATCATALIDRTVHHADVIAIEGDSYRRREAEADKKTRRPKKPT